MTSPMRWITISPVWRRCSRNDDQGFAFRFDTVADYFSKSDGLIDGRVDGLNDRIRSLEDNEANMERRLELKEIAMRAQYSALDTLVGSLQSTSAFLLQNFSTSRQLKK